MYIPKRYGKSKIDVCPFCQKQATAMNSQKVPVCTAHKKDLLDGLKCICGSILDILNGRFGVFFSCMKCGNMNLRKVLESNTIKPRVKEYNEKPALRSTQPQIKKYTTVRSDDPRYFD